MGARTHRRGPLDRDPELLIELPERIEIHRILLDERPSR
jgi:hypothetical protein